MEAVKEILILCVHNPLGYVVASAAYAYWISRGDKQTW